MTRGLLIFLLGLNCLFTVAQDTVHMAVDSSQIVAIAQNEFHSGMTFVKYLMANELYEDAVMILEQEESKSYDQSILDSVFYYQGWIHYFQKSFKSAIDKFDRVSSGSVYYDQARYYKAFCFAYQGDYTSAAHQLELMKSNVQDAQMLQFQEACLALLQRDIMEFDSLSKGFSGANYNFSTEELELQNFRDKILSTKKKSAFLAATLSTLIPGLGKFYVGYRGIPLGATAMVLPLAASAAEVFILSGPVSIPFAIFGGAFALFYIGNIWGSALSPKARFAEFNHEMDHNILFDMHIALRRSFE